MAYKPAKEIKSGIYRVLSNLYLRVPDAAFVEALREEILPFLLSARSVARKEGWPVGIVKGIDLVERYARDVAGGNQGEVAERLAADFTRLFRGVKKGYGPKPPYESLYAGEKSLHGDTSVAVEAFYRETGLSPLHDYGNEPPDHIAYELSFLGHLHLLEADLRGKGDEKGAEAIARQRTSFVGDHLSLWGKEFCDAVGEAADTGFYKGVAGLTREMLLLEQR